MLRGAAARLASATLVAAIAAGALLPAAPAAAFVDVPPKHWAASAITYVAELNPWMQDYGLEEFRPDEEQSRKLLARALVMAFAPMEPVDPAITFPDVPPEDPFYPFANVATRLRWLPRVKGGAWNPDGTVPLRVFDRAVIRALTSISPTLSTAVIGLARIHEADGDRYRPGKWFPFLQLARWFGLHKNHPDDAIELLPRSEVTRAEVAFSLWRAKSLSPWKISAAAQFGDVTLPAIDPADPLQDAWRRLTEFGLKFVGYPYVWAGEWKAATTEAYCCGGQPQGGFDCSGYVWWVLKANESGYDAARFRSYSGWSLLERSSSQIAKSAAAQIGLGELQVGDILLFASSGGKTWADIDHTGIYVGNGWMLHSSSGVNGVTLERVDTGWYADRFAYARRLMPTAPPTPEPDPEPEP